MFKQVVDPGNNVGLLHGSDSCMESCMVAKLVACLDIGFVFRMNGRVYELFGAHSNV
jgi:hypothetical protein